MSGMRRLGGARHAGEGRPLSPLHARSRCHPRAKPPTSGRIPSPNGKRPLPTRRGACRGAGQRAVGRTAGPLSPRHSRPLRPGGLPDRPDRRGAGRSTASAAGLPAPARLAGVAAEHFINWKPPRTPTPAWRRRGSSSPWARRRSPPPWTALLRPATAASCRRSRNRSSMPWRTSARRQPPPWARRWARLPPSPASAPRRPRCSPRNGRPGQRGQTALVAALADKNNWVRWYAVEALGNMGAEAASAVPALLPLLEHSDALTRRRAVEALGRIGPPAKAAAAALQNASQPGGDEAVRKAAVVALYQVYLADRAEKARLGAVTDVRQLIDKLPSGNQYAVVAAAKGLGEWGDADAVPALALALRDKHAGGAGSGRPGPGEPGQFRPQRTSRLAGGRPRGRPRGPRRRSQGPRPDRRPVTLPRRVHHGARRRKGTPRIGESISVAFRSAKVAAFAERKATKSELIVSLILNTGKPEEHGSWSNTSIMRLLS